MYIGDFYDKVEIMHIYNKGIFDRIIDFAKSQSTCKKLSVGAGFVFNHTETRDTPPTIIYSSNCSSDYNCKLNDECYKAKVTGIYESCEETRKYCKAIHAEINMINNLREMNVDPTSGILYVTRYPCLNCAEKCAEFGFSRIAYCGKQEISDEVKQIFDNHDIEVEWYPSIDYEF